MKQKTPISPLYPSNHDPDSLCAARTIHAEILVMDDLPPMLRWRSALALFRTFGSGNSISRPISTQYTHRLYKPHCGNNVSAAFAAAAWLRKPYDDLGMLPLSQWKPQTRGLPSATPQAAPVSTLSESHQHHQLHTEVPRNLPVRRMARRC